MARTESVPIVTAITSFACVDDGTPLTIRTGDRLHANHPVAQRFPACFAPDGEDSAQIGARINALDAHAREKNALE